MCGIVGEYNYRDRERVSTDLIRKMCNEIAYRGPDDSGVYIDGATGLGHRRLSILDLSEMGHQPMGSIDGKVWITFNGEIYNFLELKKSLEEKGYSFRSSCDTEVIIYLYREYGEDCLRYLRGMFAFGIWDKEKSKLFLARDRIGKKPLFYYHNGNRIIFASEIKAILQDPKVERKINYEAFADYFRYLYIPDPKTIYQNIYKLEPGHYLVCTNEGITKKNYWDISFASQTTLGIAEISEQLRKLLADSVKMRMISDVPLGAFLSGGIDSSGVVAIMAAQQKTPVTTCSIGFDSNEFDEIQYARIAAIAYKTDHHEFTVNQNSESILQDLAYYFDEPFADASAVPTFYVSKLAREKVKVALSGDGGDENFAGYQKYHIDSIENQIRKKIPAAIRYLMMPTLNKVLSRYDHKLLRKARSLATSLSSEADYGFYLSNSEFRSPIWENLVNDQTKREIGEYDPFSVTKYFYEKADTDDHLSKILYADLKTYLPGDILVKVDRTSMANSLEVRAPLLDHHIIEFSAKVPSQFKYYKGEKKIILKSTFKKILPPEITNRKKMGFTPPVGDWLRGELKNFAVDRIFSDNRGVKHFFNMNALASMWDKHIRNLRDYSVELWCILMFELWFREFMD